jgi:hypothetical protein
MKRPPLKAGDVYPSHVLRDEYGINSENRHGILVDEADVPELIRPLIPVVERWAISCDVTRSDYFDKQPESDVAKFWHDVNPQVDSINAWLDKQPEDVGQWPDAAVHFMYFLKAHSEAWQPTEEEKRLRYKRFAAAERRWNRKRGIETGQVAFQAKDFPAVVKALAPFEDGLDKITATKLAYARKRTG